MNKIYVENSRKNINSNINKLIDSLLTENNINLIFLGKLLNKFFNERKYNQKNYEQIIAYIFNTEIKSFISNLKGKNGIEINLEEILGQVIEIWNKYQLEKQKAELTSLLSLGFETAYTDEEDNEQNNNIQDIYDIIDGKNHPAGSIFDNNFLKTKNGIIVKIISYFENCNYGIVQDNEGNYYTIDKGFTLGNKFPPNIKFQGIIGGNYMLIKSKGKNHISNGNLQLGFQLNKGESAIHGFFLDGNNNESLFLMESKAGYKLVDFHGEEVKTEMQNIISVKKYNIGNQSFIASFGLVNDKLCYEIIGESEQYCINEMIYKYGGGKINQFPELKNIDKINIIHEDTNEIIFGIFYKDKMVLFSTQKGTVIKLPLKIGNDNLNSLIKLNNEYYGVYSNKNTGNNIYNKKVEQVFIKNWKHIVGTVTIDGEIFGIFSETNGIHNNKLCGITISDSKAKNITNGLAQINKLTHIKYGITKKGKINFKCLRFKANKGIVTSYTNVGDWKPKTEHRASIEPIKLNFY